MADEPRDTEQAAGARYSEGKAVQCWAPMGGLDEVWNYARHADPYMALCDDPRLILLDIERELRGALRDPLAEDPEGWRRVTVATYGLFLLLHCREIGIESRGFQYGDLPIMGTEEVCRVAEIGADKYAELDWDLGQSFSTLLSCAYRHVKRAITYGLYSMNEDDGDCTHLGHAVWNTAAILDFIHQDRVDELDDVTPWQRVSAKKKRRAESWAMSLNITPLEALPYVDAIEEAKEKAVRHVQEGLERLFLYGASPDESPPTGFVEATRPGLITTIDFGTVLP